MFFFGRLINQVAELGNKALASRYSQTSGHRRIQYPSAEGEIVSEGLRGQLLVQNDTQPT